MAKQAPHRVQMRRTKGFRLPAGAIYVGVALMWLIPDRRIERAWQEKDGHET